MLTHLKTLKLPGREGRDNGLLITLVPKVYDNVFLFVSLATLGTFNEF